MNNEAPDTIAPIFVMDLGADLSPALQALEDAYRMIQAALPDTPDATLVVKRDARAWGHITVAKTWAAPGEEAADRYEIMVSGENLRRGAEAVAGTLIHEAAHARNLAADVRDTDVNGRHNKRFKARAEEMGLTVEAHRTLGWTLTELSAEGRKSWRRLVRRIERGLKRSASAPDPLAGIPCPGRSWSWPARPARSAKSPSSSPDRPARGPLLRGRALRPFWGAFLRQGVEPAPTLGRVDHMNNPTETDPAELDALSDRIWGEGQWVSCQTCPPDDAGLPPRHHRNAHLPAPAVEP